MPLRGQRAGAVAAAFSRGLERLLAILGLAALIYCCAIFIEARAAQGSAAVFGQARGADLQQQERVTPGKESQESEVLARPNDSDTGSVVGRIDIPELALTAPITDGIGKNDLLRGVGHIPGTALAGGLGTMGLAGHRDTYFRPLRRVVLGMEIRVANAAGVYRYKIDSTEVVTPEQVQVLEIQSRPELTLITCYPFDYIGAAPKRFIVHAHLLSVAAEDK